VQYDIDADDNFGSIGQVHRKAKETREKQRKHLAGNAAAELYLDCLQLILRKQISWLVTTKNLPLELETVIRDLWDLRVRNFHGLKLAREQDDDGETGAGSGSDGETMLFSSNTDGEMSSDGTIMSKRLMVRSWTTSDGQKWPLPTLLDTLALIYLGCLTMRQPLRLGDLHRWAKENRILYLDAVRL
jgi:hypothetical protein